MDDLDHRNLGVKLKLWHLQEDAPGMVFWHPRGYGVDRVLEDYVRRKMRRAGYAEVRTPQLLPKELWGRSGHWDKFGEHMFRVDDGELAMALKPMSCPCHVQIFNKGLRSWRELPIRYAEFGACHRNEPSGSLHGIMRTRAFEQDDAHVFCREQDVESEVACFIALVGEVYRELGFPDYEVAGDAAGGARRRRRDLGLVGGEARRCRAALRPRPSNQLRRRCVLRTEAGIRAARPPGTILAVRHSAARRRAAAAARGVLCRPDGSARGP